MLQPHPGYSLWNRCKTLTGSLDPTVQMERINFEPLRIGTPHRKLRNFLWSSDLITSIYTNPHEGLRQREDIYIYWKVTVSFSQDWEIKYVTYFSSYILVNPLEADGLKYFPSLPYFVWQVFFMQKKRRLQDMNINGYAQPNLSHSFSLMLQQWFNVSSEETWWKWVTRPMKTHEAVRDHWFQVLTFALPIFQPVTECSQNLQ